MNVIDEKFNKWRVGIAKKNYFSKEVIFPRLVHGGLIVPATECISGETSGDGIVVSQENVKVGVTTADCMPLVIFSAEKGLVLHVSRKSLIHGLLDNVSAIISPVDITHIFIGPYVYSKHFVFDWEGEELAQFKKLFPEAVEVNDTIHLSLLKAVQVYFDTWGISKEKIHIDGRCTFESTELNSYRRWLATDKTESRPSETATIIWREG